MYIIIVSAQKETERERERESDPIKLSQSSSVATKVLHSISKCIKDTKSTRRIPTNKPNLAVNSRPVQTLQGPSTDLDEEIVTDFSGALGLVPGKNQIGLSEAKK